MYSSDKAGSNSDSTPKVRRRRINFDQIQATIKQLVNDASNDVRSQYSHLLTAGTVNQSLLQRRVASELMLRLAGSATEDNELNVRRQMLSELALPHFDEIVEKCRCDLRQQMFRSNNVRLCGNICTVLCVLSFLYTVSGKKRGQ